MASFGLKDGILISLNSFKVGEAGGLITSVLVQSTGTLCCCFEGVENCLVPPSLCAGLDRAVRGADVHRLNYHLCEGGSLKVQACLVIGRGAQDRRLFFKKGGSVFS